MEKRILVIDDEEDLCEILQFNLESEGYIVDVAHSAEDALEILNETHCLILLDVMMGGMSGFKMAEKVRKMNEEHIPIIFLTAKSTENDMLTGFSLGADDYIAKPFSIKELLARVKAVIKRTDNIARFTKKEVYEYNGLSVNVRNKEVRVDGELIVLTKKEFEILKLLIVAPNVFFSREMILKSVWENDSLVLDRTVDVHINRLRKKLASASRYIINRSGYGYCFEDTVNE